MTNSARPDWPHLHDYKIMHDLAAHLAAVRARDIPALIDGGKISQDEGQARIAVAQALCSLWAAVKARQPVPALEVDDHAIARDLADACHRSDAVKARWQATWGHDYPQALACLAWHAAPWDGTAPHAGMRSRIRMMHSITLDARHQATLRAIAHAPDPMRIHEQRQAA